MTEYNESSSDVLNILKALKYSQTKHISMSDSKVSLKALQNKEHFTKINLMIRSCITIILNLKRLLHNIMLH